MKSSARPRRLGYRTYTLTDTLASLILVAVVVAAVVALIAL